VVVVLKMVVMVKTVVVKTVMVVKMLVMVLVMVFKTGYRVQNCHGGVENGWMGVVGLETAIGVWKLGQWGGRN
jgi:hypothetical protein